MDQVDFRVQPVDGGWMVESSASLAPLVFRSGGCAERKAEDLARAMTAAGLDVRVLVLDRAQQIVGAKRFWAAEPARKLDPKGRFAASETPPPALGARPVLLHASHAT